MQNKKPQFKVGDSVKIKKGVVDEGETYKSDYDPDKDIIPLEGRCGRIIKVIKDNDKIFYELMWDSITINEIGYEKILEQFGIYEWDRYIIGEEDIEWCIARDTLTNIDDIYKEFTKRFLNELGYDRFLTTKRMLEND